MRTARSLLSVGLALAIAALAPAATAQSPQPAHPSTLVGIVVDSIHGVPLGGATVLLDGTTMVATTGTNGRFRIDSIAPGDYRIAVFHPILDKLGIAIGTEPLRMGADSVREVILGTPSGQTMVERSCSPASLRLGEGALMGRVEHPDTRAPMEGVRVSVVWSAIQVGAGTGVRRTPVLREATTRSTGMYVICGLPDDGRATVQAEIGPAKSAEVPVDLGVAPLILQDFTLSPLVAQGGVPLVGAAVLTGSVLDQSGRAIEGAVVTVQDAGTGGTTDSRGAFRMTRLPSGTRSVVVRKLGYTPVQVAVDLSAITPAQVSVRLNKPAQALETVAVKGRYETALQKTGFLDRQREGLGRYITAEEIQRRNAPMFSDLFHTYPGFRVERGAGGNAIRSTRNLGGSGREGGCVTFWVDRVQYRETQPGSIDFYLQPDQVMGIETYTAATAPFEFTDNRDSSCSVVVVWTNRTER